MKNIATLLLAILLSAPLVSFSQATTQPTKYYFFCYAQATPGTWETKLQPLIYTQIDSTVGYRSDIGLLVRKFHSYTKQWCPDKKRPCPSFTVGDTSLSKVLNQQKEFVGISKNRSYELTPITFKFR